MSGRILVVGDVMTDIIVVSEGGLVRGSDRRASIRQMPGGSGANQAVWLASFGADVRFLARVGEADRAKLNDYYSSCGVTPILVGDRGAPTGILVNIVDPDGERSFLTDRGANLNLSTGDLPPGLLEGSSHLVISGYSFFAEGPRAAALALVADAKARGVPVVVDPASEGFVREAGPGTFIDWTKGAALLVANYDEAFALSGLPNGEEQTRVLGAHYGRVIIKRGALGASLGDASGIRANVGAEPVEAVDTTGAGDAFLAAFLTSELNGADEATALAAGVAAGERAIGAIGGQPGRAS